MKSFKELGLGQELMKGLLDLKFENPSPIQEKAIEFILSSKKDLIALAQTGTGKTAAFSLPILNQLDPNSKELQTIIICPTRELCLQISQDIKKFTKYTQNISTTAVYGGARIDLQIRDIKKGANIVVGTPGRLCDLVRRKVLKLESIKWLVLDEADEMLDMGFKDDLDAILEQTPATRQTLLFSATMSKSVGNIAKKYMTSAVEISVGEKNSGAENVTHEYYVIQAKDRFEALKRILDFLPGVYGILFCRTRMETQVVADKLKQGGYDAEAMHGDISQGMRTKIMDRFKRKQIKLLVATDVAARGIDVSDLTHVINYNLPDQNEAYTHRTGRTGRAQKSGVAISIIGPRDSRRISELEKIIGKKFEYKKVPNGDGIFRRQIDNFLKELEETECAEVQNEKYFQEITDKLKKVKKEDLIKQFVTYNFKELLNGCRSSRDLNASAQPVRAKRDDSNNINLKINFGKKNRFDVKGLFGLINSNRKLKGVEIGKIELSSEYSIFSVDKKRAEEVVKVLNGSNYRGRKISISMNAASMGSVYDGKGGARKNKKNFRKKKYPKRR